MTDPVVKEDPTIDPDKSPLANAAKKFDDVLTYAQAVALIAIAIATLVGIGYSILEMIESYAASLGDLLLLFLYIEILSMIKGASLGTREIPIRTPVALAIVAVARFFVVDIEHMTPTFMMMTAAAIAVLVMALWVLSKVPQQDM